MIGALWTAAFAATLGAVYVGLALHYAGDMVVNLITFLAGAVLLVAERVWPANRAWLVPDHELWHDIGHFFAGFALGAFGGVALAQVLVPASLWAIWPSAWPLPVQIALALVIGEFFQYWQHRVLHTFPSLWWIHMLHHSATRMTFLKTTRIHALDIGSGAFLTTVPLLALGAPASIVLWATAFGNFTAQLQHANVPFPTPQWVNRLVGTPATHWLHHSIDKREGNSNFGMNLMVWDWLFGTYIEPPLTPRLDIGIDPNPVPASFVGQLLLPLQGLRRPGDRGRRLEVRVPGQEVRAQRSEVGGPEIANPQQART